MAKEEWGTKRTCPKCGARFYDLGKEDPVTCIECGNEWTPEPILKTKQPIVAEDEETPESKESEDGEDLETEDIDIGDDDEDDVLGDASLDDDDDDEVAAMVDTSLSEDDS